MKVIRAAHAGACYGVQRALDMALEARTAKGKTYTLGPLIHNPQAVAMLAEQGIHAQSDIDDIDNGTVIIRSHGVKPQIMRRAIKKGIAIIDATCPHVARAQKATEDLAKEGRTVLVVGKLGHPEVEGLVAYAEEAGAQVFVVGDPSDIPADLEGPVGVVVQTTQSKDTFESVVAALSKNIEDIEVKDTICFATRQRQEEADLLSRTVDAFIVIGGRNSSNTSRLFEIGSVNCEATYHIESPDEIDTSWFEGRSTIGVTAGASTPENQIEAVVKYLESLS